MTQVNQRGEPIHEDWIGTPDNFVPGEAERALLLLIDHLGLSLYRTNATKHGNVELVLRRNEED